MSKITREEALKIAKGLKHNHSNFYGDMNKIIEYLNQQTTPKELEEVIIIDTSVKNKEFDELCKDDIVQYENSLYIIDSIYKGDYQHPFARLTALLNSNFHYAENCRLLKYKGSLKRHLTSTPQLSESVETELSWIETKMLQNILSKVNVTQGWQDREIETMRKSLSKITQHIQAQASEIEDLKGIIIQQSDSRNELTNKLNDIKAWFEINLLEDEYVSILKGDNNDG